MIIFLLSFFILLTLYIFISKKNTHLKFLYPGLLTFFIFMILPIFFTIYISSTNLKTGHLLTLENAKTILLEEKILGVDKSSYHFVLSKEENQKYHIFITGDKKNFSKSFILNAPDQKVLLAESTKPNMPQETLRPFQVFEIKNKLKKLRFILPSGKALKYHRSNLLLNLGPRYTEIKLANNIIALRDNTDSTLYKANFQTGFFEHESKNLIPGFYVNIGLTNFSSLLTNQSIFSSFIQVFTWTLIWSMTSVFLTFSLGMFLAVFLNEKNFVFKKIYRILLIIPYSIPFFISILVFKGMLNKDFGIINEILRSIGVSPLSWLETPLMAKISCLLVNLWLGFPYMFLITTGILQSIPESIYEAAKIDGASKWITFKKLTLPLLMSAIGPLLIGSFAFNMNNFVGIYLLTGGGPPVVGGPLGVGTTDILISYTYRLAFEGGSGQDFGLASSIAIFIFIIIAILTLVNFKLSKARFSGASS